MSVDKFLEVYINQLSPIIQGLFVLILGLVFILLFLALKGKKGESSASSANSIEGLENTLRKVIESTQHLSATPPPSTEGAAHAAGATAGTPEDLTKLQAELAAKEKRLAELMAKVGDLEKAKPAEGAAATPPVDAAGFEARIKDLESKLKEYEIIEDDIANLSLYKEENIRLKNELNKVGGAAAASLTTAVEAIQGAEVAPEPQGESLADALKSAGGLPEVEALAAPTAPAEAVTEDPAADLVSQLASAVEGKPTAAPASVAPASPAAPAAEPVAAAPETAPVEEVPDALKGFDTDKLMEEASNLKEPDASKPPSDDDEGDVGQKLIDEFENFMKGST